VQRNTACWRAICATFKNNRTCCVSCGKSLCGTTTRPSKRATRGCLSRHVRARTLPLLPHVPSCCFRNNPHGGGCGAGAPIRRIIEERELLDQVPWLSVTRPPLPGDVARLPDGSPAPPGTPCGPQMDRLVSLAGALPGQPAASLLSSRS